MSDQLCGGSDMIGEHTVTLLLAGNPENTRQRLITALEQMGYRIMSENPLQARHGATGWANAYLSAIALEYPTQLAIGLRAQGQGATQVTFDYRVQHSGIFTAGDCQTLTREAEAIATLASQHAQAGACAGCGAIVSGEARFCRQCGAPSKPPKPAALEVLRLTAGARAGYQWIVTSLLIFLLSAFFPALAILLNKPLNKFLLISVVINALGLWALGAGLRRLHLTLNPKAESIAPLASVPPRVLAAPITNELPPTVGSSSITEGTTDLLPPLSVMEPVPIRQTQEKSTV